MTTTATIPENPAATEEVSLFRFTNDRYYVMADLGWFDDLRHRRIELLNGEVWEQYPESGGEPRPFRFSCEQYEQMDELGWFEGHRVQLLDGEIVEMSPVGSRHATIVNMIRDVLMGVFGFGYAVRTEQPLRVASLGGEPEPDIAVVQGTVLDYLHENPTTAVLVVEVAETTLRTDRVRKAAIYAAAGIAEYWIANLSSGQMEVLRDPIYDESGPRYQAKTFLTREQTVAPLEAPNAPIKISDLLP